MWYREAAYGNIDLQKYTSEKLGEDFDFQKELMSLLQSGITSDGFVIFDVLNNNLPKSKLKEYISYFWRSKNPEALAKANLLLGKYSDHLTQADEDKYPFIECVTWADESKR